MTNPLTAGLRAVHPGAILREDVLPALRQDRSVTKTHFAKLLGISRQTLYAILREEEPVSPRIAVRLGHVLGNGPDLWVRLQSTYDLEIETAKVDLSEVPILSAVD